MAAFDPGDDLTHPLDFRLARGGGVVLYRSPAVLDADIRTLSDAGYRVVRLDASGWDATALHADVAAALAFPAYYGRNLAALDDCLYDVARGDYGGLAGATGLVVVMTGYDAFTARDASLAHAVADSFARTAGQALLYGHRLLVLLQVSDPRFALPPLAAVTASWNPAEFLDSRREP